ncbi:hypothetical protein MBLNU459_g7345t1 [Dothideomycetes sp. NU459]
MLSLQPHQSMYPPSGIHFRNPFLTSSGPSHSSRSAFGHQGYELDVPSPSSATVNKVSFHARRPLTPPPDMNTVAQQVPHSRHDFYGDRSAAPAKYEPPMYSHEQSYRNVQAQAKQDITSQSSNRPRSPVFQQSSTVQSKDSTANAIAPSLQIPRSVNNSQGSLSELAAQITCMFWFESHATLERAEDAATCTFPLQPLAADAIPTTGFRKWVTTILSTTQVAQNVIILALLFIYRLKKLNPSVKGKPGSEYRLLTVALMLGNKFLDDNTYTNKTWAEVSGISVMEVHIMEVEFLSNMKYALFTSAEEWGTWQTQLGRFASFFDRASVRASFSAPSGLALPFPQTSHTLPSPPNSNQASPPYAGNNTPIPYSQPAPKQSHGPTPNPSPLGPVPDLSSQRSRKRSLESYTSEPPSKRVATATSNPAYGHSYNTRAVANVVLPGASSQYAPRVTLPSLAIPQNQPLQSGQAATMQPHLPPQLPPLSYAQRSAGVTPLPPTTWTPAPSIPASAAAAHYTSTPIQMPPLPQSLPQSRHQSPFPGSAGVSPTNGALQASQLSPSFFLAQRNSPYRPIRGVSTLLVPPPPRAMHQPQTVDREQMHYQPLGRPQERQQGQLPYVHQGQWFDGQYQPTTPSNQWAAYNIQPQQQQQVPQQHHSLPIPQYGRI